MSPRLCTISSVFFLTLTLTPSAWGAAREARYLAPASQCKDTISAAGEHAQTLSFACYINYARKQARVRPIRPVHILQRSAHRKAAEMLKYDTFAHQVNGHSSSYWPFKYGYKRGARDWTVAENLIWLSHDNPRLLGTRQAFTLWLESPGHRENILDPRWKQWGAGRALGPFQGTSAAHIWVMHFGFRLI